MMMGMVPPQSTDSEMLVLCAIMADNRKILAAMERLHNDSFYKESNRVIYEAMVDLYKQYTPIDFSTVIEKLKEKGTIDIAGGAYGVVQISNNPVSLGNMDTHLLIIEQYAICRRVIEQCSRTVQDIYTDPVQIFEHINSLNTRLSRPDIAVVGSNTSAEYRLTKGMDQVDSAMKGIQSGVTTGIDELDKYTGGWQNGDLIIIAARPAMGKSAVGINLAHNALVSGAVFMQQCEMSEVQVSHREMAMYSGFKIQNIRTGQLFSDDYQRLKEDVEKIKNNKFYIDFNMGESVTTICSRIIKHKNEYGIKLAMIDYLQLISPDNGNESLNNKIGVITRALKKLAKELSIPIIVFSQLNRDTEKRGEKRPQLSDLRDSGNIEQDADQVIFLMRPDYYTEFPVNENGESLSGKIALIIAKNRQGATGDVWVNHNLSCNLITN